MRGYLSSYRNTSHRSEGCAISSEVPCFISKGGLCMKQVPVMKIHQSKSKYDRKRFEKFTGRKQKTSRREERIQKL